jgi:phosphatidylglycerol:prolipoprotein diacylglycerol transferase
MWYGILIAFGIMLGSVIAYKRAPKHDISPDKILDILIISLPASIVGARVYYIAFNFGEYSGDLMKIINIRLGGLAIHGGLLAGFLACLIICRFVKVRQLNAFDLFAPCVALGQAIGRWGNYFNSEAYGSPTTLPWGIPIGGEMVHPTFLYESIWCFLLFLILIYIDNRRSFDGQTFLCYGMLYSAERFFVEALRTDSLMLGPYKQAQIFSAAAFVICLTALIKLSRNAKKRGKIFY